ncbi:Centrin-2 [Echinococcus granulosus]|uniref:Centrin-2 n=1 Tax=Echinococcus granulosus TaxID=6210 RepID=W6UB26_ECHGR|nr:Centrin-2 [Echinococcus granulosus]EUB58583.1 Centrin-2 [Echinococcus granulosus]
MPFHFSKSASKKASLPTPSTSIVARLREAFDKFDTNNSGMLDLEEIQAALRELGKPNNASVIHSIMQLKGLQNGITFTDFFLKWTRTSWGEELKTLPLDTVLECIKVFVTRQMNTKGARDLFKLADVDQSGKLSLAEIKRLLEASDYDVDDEELCAIFRRVDANRDGELDDKEFLDLVRYLIENK